MNWPEAFFFAVVIICVATSTVLIHREEHRAFIDRAKIVAPTLEPDAYATLLAGAKDSQRGAVETDAVARRVRQTLDPARHPSNR